jgi:hypothetical protein
MNIKEKYKIKEISSDEARDIIINNHYLHRARPSTNAFGLFEGDELIGVITYCQPASPNVARGICGEEERLNVRELSRLWIKDDSLKNAESFLIANTIKRIKEDIIISYSEPQHNHRGVVYQATNFIYCGLSAKRTDPKIKGMEEKHNRALYFGNLKVQNTAELKERFGNKNITTIKRERKHRYIYFNCSKGRKKYLLKKLRYKVEQYPKTNFIPTYNEDPKKEYVEKKNDPLTCDVCGYKSPTQVEFDSHLTRRFHLEQIS